MPMDDRDELARMLMQMQQMPYPDDATGTDLAIENQRFIDQSGAAGAFAEGAGNGLMFGIPTLRNPDLYSRLRSQHGSALNAGNVAGAAPWAVVHPGVAGAALGGAVLAPEMDTTGAMAAEEERRRRSRR